MQIRLNLVVALAAAQLAFLSGINALEPKVRLLDCLFRHKQVFFSLFVVFFVSFCFPLMLLLFFFKQIFDYPFGKSLEDQIN